MMYRFFLLGHLLVMYKNWANTDGKFSTLFWFEEEVPICYWCYVKISQRECGINRENKVFSSWCESTLGHLAGSLLQSLLLNLEKLWCHVQMCYSDLPALPGTSLNTVHLQGWTLFRFYHLFGASSLYTSSMHLAWYIGLQRDLVGVLAFGTDREESLAEAFKHEFCFAVHLTCFIHKCRNIER